MSRIALKTCKKFLGAKPPDYEKYEHNTFAFHETIQKSFSKQSTFQVWGAKATNDLWPNIFWGPWSIYLKSLSSKYHVQKCKTHHGGSKKPYFFPTTRWWNNHLHYLFYDNFIDFWDILMIQSAKRIYNY